jgi:hypothetical protein
MTTSALLARYLFYESSQITETFIEQIIDEGIKPNDIILFVVKFMSKYALTGNVWVMMQCREFLQALNEIKLSKSRDTERKRFIKLCMGIFGILMYCEKGQYTFVDENDTYKVFANDIQSILLHEQNTVWDDTLSNFKGVLKDDVYNLLNTLQKHFKNMFGENEEVILRKSFVILRYLLTLTPKHVFKNTKHGNPTKLDVIDMVFIVCMMYSQNTFCSKELASYIAISKDIFYVKVSKKDKKERVNLMFYVVYTIITRKAFNTPFDGLGIEHVENAILEEQSLRLQEEKLREGEHALKDNAFGTNDKAKKRMESEDASYKCRFLYFYSEYDDNLALQIKFERERIQLLDRIEQTSSMRNVDVAWNIENEKNFICVSKLQGREM